MQEAIASPGTRMMYLIKRRPASSREELIAHWFANHMPGVIHSLQANEPIARRYVVTLFDPDRDGTHSWDGVAQLDFDQPLPAPATPYGETPTDTFQEYAEPYSPWATQAYVVMDGSEHFPVKPLTLNDPFPCTRSGFFKVTFLVSARPDTDYESFYQHWLNVHVPNVAQTMAKVDGLGYLVSHSLNPTEAAYAGMAELYFHDPSGWTRYKQAIQPDGMEQWVADEGTLVLRAHTELVGIP